MPFANRLIFGTITLVVEEEAKAISVRTKAALSASKARGTKLRGYRGGDCQTITVHNTGACLMSFDLAGPTFRPPPAKPYTKPFLPQQTVEFDQNDDPARLSKVKIEMLANQ